MGEKIVVGTVQFACKLGDKKENIRRAMKYVKLAAKEGAKNISLPELFSTGYSPGGMIPFQMNFSNWRKRFQVPRQ